MASYRPEAKNSTRISHTGATWAEKGAGKTSLLLVAMLAGLCAGGCKKAVLVPNVEQQDLEQAKQTLAAAQLQPGTITGGQGPGSYVLKQSPPPNTQVAAKSPVDLTVALPVAVPDLVKSNVTDAVNTLQGMGLRVAFLKEPTRRLFGGPKVTAQSPVATSLVRQDSVVTITVSAPPDLSALVGAVTKEPAYQNLKPEYRQVLDSFLK